MADVLISIRPEWCALIASGKKTIEVRKAKPKLETPFKCYIYCTQSQKTQFWTGHRYSYADDHSHNQFDRCVSGKVIGEFVCDKIDQVNNCGNAFLIRNSRAETNPVAEASCLSYSDMREYLGEKDGYAWHISELKLYDEPRSLSSFHRPPGRWCSECGYWENGKCYHTKQCPPCEHCSIKRPPQSWCYVEVDGHG